MADEVKPKYLEDMARYFSGSAGFYALSKADEKEQPFYLKGTVKTLIDKLYDPSTRDLDILTKAAMSSEEGMNIMVGEATKKYESSFKECTFANWYYSNSKAAERIISKDKKEKFDAVVLKYGEKTIGSIMQSYEDAKLTMKGSDKLFTKEQKEKAEKTIKEFDPIVSVISQIKRIVIESSDDYKKINEYAYKEMFSQTLDAVNL